MVLTTGREGSVATLTLNRPDRLNALNWELLRALDEVTSALGQDQSVRCVLLSGAGERAFSAGADLRAGLEFTAGTAREWIRLGHRVFNRLVVLPQPVVAAIRGYALGGGLELALACDFRVAAEDARLAQPEVSRGWLPGWGGLWRLAAIVGPARAREMVLLGEPLGAEMALAWGLVHRVVPPVLLTAEAMALAQRLAGLSPDAVRVAKAVLATPGLVIGEAAIAEDAETLAAFVAGPHYRAEIEAFLNRRKG